VPALYKIDKKRQLVLTCGFGSFTLADAQAHEERLLDDPDFDPNLSEIADFTCVTEFAIGDHELEKLAKKATFSVHSRRALIVPNHAASALRAINQTAMNSEGPTNFRVFRDLTMALDWVFPKKASAQERDS
jgi:hypothetical protein